MRFWGQVGKSLEKRYLLRVPGVALYKYVGEIRPSEGLMLHFVCHVKNVCRGSRMTRGGKWRIDAFSVPGLP